MRSVGVTAGWISEGKDEKQLKPRAECDLKHRFIKRASAVLPEVDPGGRGSTLQVTKGPCVPVLRFSINKRQL